MTILSVRWVVSALTAFVTPLVLHAQVKVLMNRYGGQRTGANLTFSSAGATAISVDFTGTSTAVMGAAEVAHDERLPRYHQHERDHPGRRTRAHR